MSINRDANRAHWEDWARRFGPALRATTKAGTAKRLEIDALARAIDRHRDRHGDRYRDRERPPRGLLEVGCGNGYNVLALARAFPELRLTGIDYAATMVEMARRNVAEAGLGDRIRIEPGDVLDLAAVEGLEDTYDVVVSDRCLINLDTLEHQKRAITALAGRLAPGGLLLLVENSARTHAAQNALRERLGLPRREPAEFNLFLDEDAIRPHLERHLDLLEVEDFISLHDLVLYVLVPATNGGSVDYDHPLVEAATALSLALGPEERAQLGAFGQNRLFVARRARGDAGR